VLTAEDAGRRVATELHAALSSLYARTAIPLRLSADFVSKHPNAFRHIGEVPAMTEKHAARAAARAAR
jgi:hypothetical protein